jgi:3,4-dehydroadipyl-CoA semialdehyde dehydrogenase
MSTTALLPNFVCGRWTAGSGEGDSLIDPTTDVELARASTQGIDLGAALSHARDVGGPGLRALTFAQRAAALDAVAKVLIAGRVKYGKIALENSGNTERDASFDIDGAISTIRYFSKIGAPLGEVAYVRDGEPFAIGRDPSLEALHLAAPRMGAAIHINAFNFPAWGTWEKAAVSLLAGVPVVTKPATATSLLAWEMVRDVVEANVLPEGSLSILCGGVRDLLDHVEPEDVIAFTGSAATAVRVRANTRVIERNPRVNCEADSLNAIVLGPDVEPDSPEFEQFVDEVVREMTLKTGQKCTAIRRVVVPAQTIGRAADALSAALAAIVVGDPRHPEVTMGPVVTNAQQKALGNAATQLRAEASVIYEGSRNAVKSSEPERGTFFMPLLLRANDSRAARAVHEVEAFGPIATLLSYDNPADAAALVARGLGSLVSSVVTADPQFSAMMALSLAAANGRVLLLDQTVRKANPGHGVVVPSCTHGGPGRAGGGEEMGGLRALWFYLRRSAVQGPSAIVRGLADASALLANA